MGVVTKKPSMNSVKPTAALSSRFLVSEIKKFWEMILRILHLEFSVARDSDKEVVKTGFLTNSEEDRPLFF